MAGLDKLEGYLIDLGISYEELGPNTWLVNDPDKGLTQIVVLYNEPVVVIRANVMKVPDSRLEEFFRQLLVLNADSLLHGAYALEGEDIVLMDTLEYGTLDKPEFEASLDAIGFALSEHYPLLSRFGKK